MTGDSGMPDAGQDAGPPVGGQISTTYPAFKLDVPQVVAGQTPIGPVLANPVVVPVFFANDDMSADGFVHELTQFVTLVGTTSYWSSAVGEYGVGSLTAVTPYVSSESPTGTIADSDIQNWILHRLATDPTFPQPTANTIYAMHYPATVTISLSNSTSCNDFGGYHSDFQLPGTSTVTIDLSDAGTADGGEDDAGELGDGGVVTFVSNPNNQSYAAYAVIPRCPSFGALTGIDAVTGAESHELAEAATDPYPNDEPAYSNVDDKHFFWERALGGGEVGDMCAQFPNAFAKFEGLAYTVQRIWSNKNATEGHDPCQPELPGEVYFNSMPELKDSATVGGGGMSITVESVNVPVGSSKTINLDLFSEGDTGGPWMVQVEDYSQLAGGTALVDYALDPLSGQNGNQLQLTVTPKTASQSHRSALFIVKSIKGNDANLWIGAVDDQPDAG
jgi:hypothetical protein